MIATPIQIRFNDCDMGGHVHNAAYLHYFESARINFFMQNLAGNWDWKKQGIILKKNIVEYNIPTFIEDNIRVEVSSKAIGNKSFTLTYTVRDDKNNIKATGESIVVCFDYTKQETIQIPDNILKALQKHEV
jgi:acyl-CoA thioester hydrolase